MLDHSSRGVDIRDHFRSVIGAPDGLDERQDLCPRQVTVTLPRADLRWGLAQWSGDVGQINPAARMGSRGQKQVVRQLVVAVAAGFGLEFDYPGSISPQHCPIRPAVLGRVHELRQQILVDERVCLGRSVPVPPVAMGEIVQELQEAPTRLIRCAWSVPPRRITADDQRRDQPL